MLAREGAQPLAAACGEKGAVRGLVMVALALALPACGGVGQRLGLTPPDPVNLSLGVRLEGDTLVVAGTTNLPAGAVLVVTVSRQVRTVERPFVHITTVGSARPTVAGGAYRSAFSLLAMEINLAQTLENPNNTRYRVTGIEPDLFVEVALATTLAGACDQPEEICRTYGRRFQDLRGPNVVDLAQRRTLLVTTRVPVPQ